MPLIEVDIETAQRLDALAAAQGVSASEYIRSIVPAAEIADHANASIEDLDAELERLTLNLPFLPSSFSRADIYDDHD